MAFRNLIPIALMGSVLLSSPTYANQQENAYQGKKQYASNPVVAELTELLANPNAVMTKTSKGTVVTVAEEHSLWFFTNNAHPASPSYLKRELISVDGRVDAKMSVVCGSSKEICDSFFQDGLAQIEQLKSAVANLEKTVSNSLIDPVIDPKLKNSMNNKPVSPLIQAVAYADAVSRVCEIEVPLRIKMKLESGISNYTIMKNYKETGSLKAPDTSADMIGFMNALVNSKLIRKDGSADKTNADVLCTEDVQNNLLGALELIGDGKLDKVDFLRPYL